MTDVTLFGRWRAATSLMWRSALDWMFPRTCPVCGVTLTGGERLMCLGCMADLPRTRLHTDSFNSIHKRIGGKVEVDIAAGWFYYYSDSRYAELIKEAKYGDRPKTAYLMGLYYGRELADESLGDRFDVLLPVPLHRNKMIRRGYNQSVEFARGLAESLSCEVGDNIVATRGHSTQTRRSGIERYENVKGSYSVKNPDELEGLHVAVVDDIVTTGSTVLDCINALSGVARPASISVLAAGVAHMH